MYESTTQFLSDRARAYEGSWREGDVDALACWELVARIKFAVTLFEVIRRTDQQIAEEIRVSSRERDDAMTRVMDALNAAWEKPSGLILSKLAAMSAKGCAVDGARAFEDAVLDARSILAISVERIDGAARQLRDGRGRSMAEVADGVRRRLGA